MVDAIGLRLGEHAAHVVVDAIRAGKVATDRFFQHHARGALVQAVLGQTLADVHEQLGRGGEIEDANVVRPLAKQFGEAIPIVILARIQRAVADEAEECVALLRRVIAGIVQRHAYRGAITVVVERFACRTNDATAHADLPGQETVEQRRQQLAHGEIAGAAEDHQVERIDGQGSRGHINTSSEIMPAPPERYNYNTNLIPQDTSYHNRAGPALICSMRCGGWPPIRDCPAGAPLVWCRPCKAPLSPNTAASAVIVPCTSRWPTCVCATRSAR